MFKPKRYSIKPLPKPEIKGKGLGELIDKIKTIKLKDDKNKKKHFNKQNLEMVFISRYIIMSVSDHVVLSKSKEQVYESLFEKNEWLVVNDTMVDYNSNTSIIETAPLANNDKFVVYNKGYI